MIIFKDKSFLKMDLYPDTDWVGNADFILDDNDEKDAEIEEKIISMYPNFDFVFDDDGNISDVVEAEPEPAPPAITTEQRMEAMENAMAEIIEILMGGE